ncbi:hypothetical protein F5Y09DRAFT_341109 [Xylaria sp. FL1042]|nr:hypothetical protein F5Y09DRAFT_341109 [Xylaria sp. FL1042]
MSWDKTWPVRPQKPVFIALRAGRYCALLVLVRRGLGDLLLRANPDRKAAQWAGLISQPHPTLGLIDSSSQNGSKKYPCAPPHSLRPHGGVVVPWVLWVPPGPFLMKEHGGPRNNNRSLVKSLASSQLLQLSMHLTVFRIECLIAHAYPFPCGAADLQPTRQ